MVDYKAVQVDFKKRDKSGRIIRTIERWYKIKDFASEKNGNEHYSLNQILDLYAKTTGIEGRATIDDGKSIHEQYREEYMLSRIDSRRIPLKLLAQMIWYSFGIFIGVIAFLKFFTFEIYSSVDVKYRIPIYIVSLIIGIGTLYFWKYHPQIMTTLFGENKWIDVLEFYDNPKRYYRSIGSGRANRFNNIENYEVYLSAVLNEKNINLIIEQRVYRNICDLKRIPVRVYKNKVYVNEFAVNIQSIEWRKKQ